jgi:predicted ABC-type ATPase
MKKLIIMRGLPGCGKSTLATHHKTEAIKAGLSCIICATDDFIMVDGEYKLEREKFGWYHKQNFLKAQQAIIDETNVVIIDNTNVDTNAIRPYVEIALEGDYIVHLIDVDTPWAKDVNGCIMHGSHGVPQSSYDSMTERWMDNDEIGEALAEELNCEYDILTEVLCNNELSS